MEPVGAAAAFAIGAETAGTEAAVGPLPAAVTGGAFGSWALAVIKRYGLRSAPTTVGGNVSMARSPLFDRCS